MVHKQLLPVAAALQRRSVGRPSWQPSNTPCAVVPLQIVTSAIETQNVVVTCAGSELMKNMLPHLLEQLELCQKSLSAYLETKRAEFPR